MFRSKAERSAALKWFAIHRGVGKISKDFNKINEELFNGAVEYEEARRGGFL